MSDYDWVDLESEWERYEWDETKSQSNRKKHGLSFKTAAAIFNGPVIVREDDRWDYGEQRFIALGMVQGRCLTVVFTPRPGGVCRIVSAWKAGAHDRALYTEILERTHPPL